MGTDLYGRDIGRGYSQRRDGYYFARLKRNGQLVICETGKDLQELKRRVEAKKQMINNSNAHAELTVEEWFEEWFDTYKAPAVKEQSIAPMKRKVNNTFMPYIGKKKLVDIRSIDVQRAINSLLEEEVYARSSIKEALGRLRECFASAVNNRFMNVNPAFDLVVPFNEEHCRSDRWLTTKEIDIFLKAAENTWWEEMLYVAIYTGLRVGELGGLRWEDIDWQRKRINVRQNLVSSYDNGVKTLKPSSLKTQNSYRSVPFMKDVEEMLRRQKKKTDRQKRELGPRWRNDEKVFGNLVFVSSMGSPMMRYNAKKAIDTVVNNINMEEALNARKEHREPAVFEHVYPHALRHTFASLCFEAGLQPKTVQKLMGHANYSTTIDIYTHITDRYIEEDIEKFNNFGS